MNRATSGASLLAACAALGIAHGAEPQGTTAETWLARMAAATAVEYRGVLVYVHDGRVDSLQVTRVIGPEGPREHLVSLNGERREIVREGRRLRRVDEGGTVTEVESVRSPQLAVEAARLAAAGGYKLSVAGEDRVAGHDSVVLVALPLDDSRYGYRLWLERETALLVGSTLQDSSGAVLENLMFTSLELRPPAVNRSAGGATKPPPRASTTVPAVAGPVNAGLPRGFELVATRAAGETRRQYVYSDGLASVSVYLEPLAPGSRALLGAASRGAINAYGRSRDGMRVLVIGDLPARTVERIAEAVEPLALAN